MAKLLFRYGAMNSGKTTILIQTAYNYEERDQKVIVIKPSEDTKGATKIVSRLGVDREVDYLINKDTNIIDLIEDRINELDFKYNEIITILRGYSVLYIHSCVTVVKV